MKRLLFFLMLILFAFSSCEPVFPDENLDHFWRLRTIEYKSGYNFQGQACKSETVKDYMLGFARHLVVIKDVKDKDFVKEIYGVTTELGDSIKFDFSIYATSMVDSLKLCGMDSLVTTFKVEYPDRNSMVLSSPKTILSLEKW